MMHYFRRFCAVLAGFVLLASGLLKLLDPTGTALIVDGYWQWMHLEWMHPVSKAMGFALSMFEAFIGVGLITGLRRHFFSLAAFVLCSFFTVISTFLLILNPNMDCGCFGQAFHLTHLQTFLKNIVLLALIALVHWLPGEKGKPRKYKRFSFFLTLAMILVFGIYGLGGQMLKDSTYLAPGQYVEAVNAFDENGNDISEILKGDKTLIISVYDPQRLDPKQRTDIEMLRSEAENIGFKVVYLGIPEPDGNFYTADYKSLISLNRFNAGLTYVDGGLVIKKWGRWGTKLLTKDTDALLALYEELPPQVYIDDQTKRDLAIQGYMLGLVALLLLL